MSVVYRLVCLLLLMSLTAADEYSYTVIVPAGKTECYSHAIVDTKYRAFEIDYQVCFCQTLIFSFFLE